MVSFFVIFCHFFILIIYTVLEKFRRCRSLANYFEILLGGEDSDAKTLQTYLDPAKKAQWVIDSTLLKTRPGESSLVR